MEQQPIPINKPVSNKQPSLLSSTSKIGRYARISTKCGPAPGSDLFYDKDSIAKLMKSPHRTFLIFAGCTISILLEFNCVSQFDTRCTD